MKVEKSIVTTYEVDLGNTPKTPLTIARAINYIADAGVDLGRAEFEDGEYKKFYLILKEVAYYDDSTLNRMSAGESPRYEVKVNVEGATTAKEIGRSLNRQDGRSACH